MLGSMDSDDQWVAARYSADAVATPATARGQLTNNSAVPSCILEVTQAAAVRTQAKFVSMDSGGFTVHFDTNVGGNARFFSLALAGTAIGLVAAAVMWFARSGFSGWNTSFLLRTSFSLQLRLRGPRLC